MKKTLGHEWGERERSRGQHPLFRWLQKNQAYSHHQPGEPKLKAIVMMGFNACWLHLTYALYLIAHHDEIPKPLPKRLRNHVSFMPAYHEAVVGAALLGKTGKGIHADGMVEHDGMVGELLKQLDDLGIADNTIVLYTTDNGAEIALWPDGALTPFHGEKGTTWEGGMRIPMMVRWPGVVKPGTQYNEIISLIDWFPTLCAAAGVPDIKEKMKAGFNTGKKTFKVHLDGYNFMPFFKCDEKQGPRDVIYYFDQGGNLNALRWNDWKLSFATSKGNIATGTREVSAWALITNLRMDPYERGLEEGGGAIDFLARNIWLLVPIQGKVKEFFSDFNQFPYQEGNSLNAAGINYGMLRQQAALQRLKELESFAPR